MNRRAFFSAPALAVASTVRSSSPKVYRPRADHVECGCSQRGPMTIDGEFFACTSCGTRAHVTIAMDEDEVL